MRTSLFKRGPARFFIGKQVILLEDIYYGPTKKLSENSIATIINKDHRGFTITFPRDESKGMITIYDVPHYKVNLLEEYSRPHPVMIKESLNPTGDTAKLMESEFIYFARRKNKMFRDYKIGDKVEMINKKLVSYGLIGTIKSEVEEFLGHYYYKVELKINNKFKVMRILAENFKKID